MRKSKQKSKKRNSKIPSSNVPTTSWVDTIGFCPIEQQQGPSSTEEEHSFSIISWNVLANAYCSRRSQQNLPPDYQRVVFSDKRKQRIQTILRETFANVDIICLQEVDMDEIGHTLKEAFYSGVETPKTRGGAGGRVDACATYVRQETCQLLENELIELDDLATLSSQSNVNLTSPEDKGAVGNLQGLQQSFLRRKMAMLTRVLHKESGKTFVVSNAHLYWNPGFEYVKLCQIHYVLQRAKAFCRPNEPFVLCGDLNSKPNGVAHSYLSRGFINAKRVAPWYWQPHPDEETMEADLTNGMVGLQLDDGIREKPLKVRYILDASLNRLCRWLRILGQDAALETDQEEKRRTGDSDIVIFQRCRDEKRILVTTSTRLMQRKDCPTGTYLINPTVLPYLEVVMVHMLLTHGVVLEPETFLGRCVVCNGDIVEIQHYDEKRKILKKYEAPTEDLDSGMGIFQCNNPECRQGYWWNDKPTSSASRVKTTATRLFECCLRGGVPVQGSLGMFDYIDVENERTKGWDMQEPGSSLLQQKYDVVDWLKNEHLECPFSLESCYASKDEANKVVGEILPFTNVTSDFVDTLDYIFLSKSGLKLSERLYVPKTFTELNAQKITNGHYLPSNVWPSDHLAIGAKLTFIHDSTISTVNEKKFDIPFFCQPIGESDTAFVSSSSNPPQLHDRRCDCGCVPSIPSLFEMAELRRKLKEAKNQ